MSDARSWAYKLCYRNLVGTARSNHSGMVFAMRLLVTGGAGFIGANFVHLCPS